MHPLQTQCCNLDGFSEGLLGDLLRTDHRLPRGKLSGAEQCRSVLTPLSPALRECRLQQSPLGSHAVQTVGIGKQMAPLAAAPGSLAVLGAASVWHETLSGCVPGRSLGREYGCVASRV